MTTSMPAESSIALPFIDGIGSVGSGGCGGGKEGDVDRDGNVQGDHIDQLAVFQDRDPHSASYQ